MSAGSGGGVGMDGRGGMGDGVSVGNGVGKGDWLCCIGMGHGSAASLEGGGDGGDCTEEDDG